MFSESLGVFFDVATGFAVNATYQGATIPVILDQAYMGIDQGDIAVDAKDVQVLVQDASVPVVRQGHLLTIGAVVYKISGVEPDGTGLTVLRLERQ